MTIDSLEELKKRGESKLYIFGATRDHKDHQKDIEFDLYNIDDLINIKLKIEDLKKSIVVPSSEDKHRQKKIYGQIVRLLSNNIEYDWLAASGEQSGKYEKATHKKWEEYLKENEKRDLSNMQIESRNLLGLVRRKSVCEGNVEIIRNLAAEYGIETTGIIGNGHIWNQVKLDEEWYNDDFTNYQIDLSQEKLDKCNKLFLGGHTDKNDEFSKRKTINEPHTVGKNYSLADKKFLLNYGREQQQTTQQEIQSDEKVKPSEESIKDDIGEELKPKTQEQKQNEKDAETLWMNRLQASDNTVDKMQEGAKKKQEVTKLIKNLEQERIQDRNDEIQEENQNEGQR